MTAHLFDGAGICVKCDHCGEAQCCGDLPEECSETETGHLEGLLVALFQDQETG